MITTKAVGPMAIKVVAAEGDGTALISGELELEPITAGPDGRYVIEADKVKRALVAWLREAADELEQVLDGELDEQGLDAADEVITTGGAA